MKQIKMKLFCLLFSLIATLGIAQPRQKLVDISIIPVEKDWKYEIGERVDFQITVSKNDRMLEGTEIQYQIGLEEMQPSIDKTVVLGDKPLIVKGIALKNAGFVRCKVTLTYNEKKYSAIGAAAVQPELIEPTVKNPDDFDAFWNDAKAKLAKIPMNAKVTLQADLCKPDYNVYHVELDNFGVSNWQGNSKFYGMLSVPKKSGKYPAILAVPGAGVRPYFGDDRAAKGAIVFKVGIHGIPVNQESKVYTSLAGGPLSGYAKFNMHDKDAYYYKRVYLGCVRAVDFIYSLPAFDGENLVTSGGSQGGALSIVTAALDDRVKGLVAFYPALSDMTGYLHGRVGGWPHQFKHVDPSISALWENTAGYYDVVNFAKRLKVPGWYSWGYNDPVCAPTTTYSVYNSIEAPKELHVFEETGHWTYPEQWDMANEWLFKQLMDE